MIPQLVLMGILIKLKIVKNNLGIVQETKDVTYVMLDSYPMKKPKNSVKKKTLKPLMLMVTHKLLQLIVKEPQLHTLKLKIVSKWTKRNSVPIVKSDSENPQTENNASYKLNQTPSPSPIVKNKPIKNVNIVDKDISKTLNFPDAPKEEKSLN